MVDLEVKLKIITPDNVLYHDNYSMVILPGAEGMLAVLPGHISMIVKLKRGILEAVDVNKSHHKFIIDDGVARIHPNGVDVAAKFVIDTQVRQINDINQRLEELRNKSKDYSDDNNVLQKEVDFLTSSVKIFSSIKN